jgi:hypothetical protein
MTHTLAQWGGGGVAELKVKLQGNQGSYQDPIMI